jgi:hypothetical protein
MRPNRGINSLARIQQSAFLLELADLQRKVPVFFATRAADFIERRQMLRKSYQ